MSFAEPSVFFSDFAAPVRFEKADGSFFVIVQGIYEEGETQDFGGPTAISSSRPQVTVARSRSLIFNEGDFVTYGDHRFEILDIMADETQVTFHLSDELGTAGGIHTEEQ